MKTPKFDKECAAYNEARKEHKKAANKVVMAMESGNDDEITQARKAYDDALKAMSLAYNAIDLAKTRAHFDAHGPPKSMAPFKPAREHKLSKPDISRGHLDIRRFQEREYQLSKRAHIKYERDAQQRCMAEMTRFQKKIRREALQRMHGDPVQKLLDEHM
jgi:hypothetical protein